MIFGELQTCKPISYSDRALSQNINITQNFALSSLFQEDANKKRLNPNHNPGGLCENEIGTQKIVKAVSKCTSLIFSNHFCVICY